MNILLIIVFLVTVYPVSSVENESCEGLWKKAKRSLIFGPMARGRPLCKMIAMNCPGISGPENAKKRLIYYSHLFKYQVSARNGQKKTFTIKIRKFKGINNWSEFCKNALEEETRSRKPRKPSGKTKPSEIKVKNEQSKPLTKKVQFASSQTPTTKINTNPISSSAVKSKEPNPIIKKETTIPFQPKATTEEIPTADSRVSNGNIKKSYFVPMKDNIKSLDPPPKQINIKLLDLPTVDGNTISQKIPKMDMKLAPSDLPTEHEKTSSSHLPSMDVRTAASDRPLIEVKITPTGLPSEEGNIQSSAATNTMRSLESNHLEHGHILKKNSPFDRSTTNGLQETLQNLVLKYQELEKTNPVIQTTSKVFQERSETLLKQYNEWEKNAISDQSTTKGSANTGANLRKNYQKLIEEFEKANPSAQIPSNVIETGRNFLEQQNVGLKINPAGEPTMSKSSGSMYHPTIKVMASPEDSLVPKDLIIKSDGLPVEGNVKSSDKPPDKVNTKLADLSMKDVGGVANNIPAIDLKLTPSGLPTHEEGTVSSHSSNTRLKTASTDRPTFEVKMTPTGFKTEDEENIDTLTDIPSDLSTTILKETLTSLIKQYEEVGKSNPNIRSTAKALQDKATNLLNRYILWEKTVPKGQPASQETLENGLKLLEEFEELIKDSDNASLSVPPTSIVMNEDGANVSGTRGKG